MRNIDILAYISANAWLIEPVFARKMQPLIRALADGRIEPEAKPNLLTIVGTKNYSDVESLTGLDIAANSIGVVSVNGAMTRHSGWCTDGTDQIAEQIKELANHASIKSIVLSLSSPGGAADSVPPLVRAIEDARPKKKVVAIGSNICSAAYWAAAACDAVYLDSQIATVGSIGVMISLQDDSEMLNKMGIKEHYINATQSFDKNKAMTDALGGQYDTIRTELLDVIATHFLDYVTSRRPNLDAIALTGKVYLAQSAQTIGLIDGVMTLNDYLKHETTQSQIQTMTKKSFPFLSAMLGIAFLEQQADGNYFIDSSQINTLRAKMATAGVQIAIEPAAEGRELSAAEISALEQEITSSLFTAKNHAHEAITELERKVAELGTQPEPVDVSPAIQQPKAPKIMPAMKEFTERDRPWNSIARLILAGDTRTGSSMRAHLETHSNLKLLIDDFAEFTQVAASSSVVDIEKVNTELGLHQQVDQMPKAREESDFAKKILDTLFPAFSTGVQNEYSQISMYASEFLQARNKEWSTKGGFKFDAETITVNEWQVSVDFSPNEIWAFTRSWLNSLVSGDNPYQLPLVAYLAASMLSHVNNVERPRQFIKGVYNPPADGVAGPSINAMSGILRAVQERIGQLRVLPTFVGTGDHAMYDEAGMPNPNHFYWKLDAVYKSIPQELRDAFSFIAYANRDDAKAYREYMVKVLANDPNYTAQEAHYTEENLRLAPVPFWPKGLIILTIPNNFVRVYRERGDDNKITIERHKRETSVFMDGAGKLSPIYSGQKYGTMAELEAAGRTTQAIFTNAEFGPYTPIQIAAGDVTPSVATHNTIVTTANAGATAITKFDDATPGQIIYIIGGAATNASTIATGGNFVGVPSGGLTFTTGFKAKFMVSSDGLKFILLDTWTAQSEGTIELPADNPTPSLAGGTVFRTPTANTDGNAAVTDLLNAQVGVLYTIIGGGGTHPTTIAKSGKFANISNAFTATAGATLKLMYRNSGDFIEII